MPNLLGHRTTLDLPTGLPHRGRRRTRSEIAEVTGLGELTSLEVSDPYESAQRLLEASVVSIGPLRSPGRRLRRLQPLDRDLLVVQLEILTFGHRRYLLLTCPHCDERFDLELDLRQLEAPEPAALGGELEVEEQRVSWRFPTVGQELRARTLAPDQRGTWLLQQCLVGADTLGLDEVLRDLSEAGREAVLEAVQDGPRLSTTLELPCPTCSETVEHHFDPVVSLLDGIESSRDAVLDQVHALASTYHWSHAEILGLPRRLRHEYLRRIAPASAPSSPTRLG